jgi:transcriptional regulator with PAS, ATPase and Fis domain
LKSNLKRNGEQNASAIEKNEKRESLSDVSRIEQLWKMNEKNFSDKTPFLIGQSEAFFQIQSLIDRVKDHEAPVFIYGESGTGKELIAQAIHYRGLRKNRLFIAVNCGAIPDYLLESELFGHAKGAFTGALRDKTGLIEEANGGTFFLDEIGDLSLHLQAKLLRLLQEKEIRRIGENRTRQVDVRFISATNKNIEREIERGNFREDLYYRLRIITIEVPPLRERKEDLLLLVNYFIEKYCQEMNRERVQISPLALELFANYSWPGNVRELQNEIQRCLVFSGEENLIREEHLSPKINPQGESSPPSSLKFLEAKAEFERRFVSQALLRCEYNRTRTAEEIGLTRQGLFKLIKKHKIDVPSQKITTNKKEKSNGSGAE